MVTLQNKQEQVLIDRWRSASLSNRFMFRLVMEDEELCKETLEVLLGFKIAEIEYLEPEKSLEAKLSSKGIRLDIFIKDMEGNVFDLEMQASDQDHDALGRRTRYYQSMMDCELLKKGTRYALLPRSMVIFICKFDPFGLSFPRYTFANLCEENKELELKDDSYKIFINTVGKKDGLRPEVVNFMEYINTGIATAALTKKLDKAVERWRGDDEKAVMYMTYEQEQMEAEARGEKRGRAEGRAEGKIEGRALKTIEIAEKLIRKGNSANDIMELTDLPLDKLQEIAERIGVELVIM